VQKALQTRQRRQIALAASRAAAKAAQVAADAAAEQFRIDQAKITADRFDVFKKRIVYKPTLKGVSPLSKKEIDEVVCILELFAQHCRDYTPTKIERIYNNALNQKFDETLQRLQEEGSETDEMLMFHGTAPANIKK
jgi:hypothetical protein